MSESTGLLTQIPSSDIDPFADKNLIDPLPMHNEFRRLGPVVHLPAIDAYVLTSYHDVREVLSRWEDFQVGAGVGLSNFHKEVPWRPPATPTEADPPGHDAPRRVLSTVLSASVLRGHTELWGSVADEMVDAALAKGQIDVVPELAAAYPLRVFPDAVGLSRENREDLLVYGDLVFNAFGPKNELFLKSAARLAELSAWVTELCKRENLSAGGFGMAIWEAADEGELLHDQAPLVVRSLLSAGIDTTVHGISALIGAFAANPDQWNLLRSRPELARSAFDEAVRWASPLQTVFHTTARVVQVAGFEIPKHEKVLLSLGAANRDPNRWERPNDFDITRDPSGHLGFGMGIHQCVGQHVARLEAMSLVNALIKKVERFELAGTPTRSLNNTIQSWESLPVKLHAA